MRFDGSQISKRVHHLKGSRFLPPVRPNVGHLMVNNKMMLGVDGTLNIVPDHRATSAACGYRARIGIGQRYPLVLGLRHQGVQTV